ncbi:NmrA family NAD(P)-binding protein [Aquimarina sediminis]|uniref:NmrA family NAD(P)-binding protein n=1 Tax=Aquimarina sediminis TaxID=2070536 RepID=UPI000CA056D7|nr:NmrA family NAD(P)-binding protein [Aquimarina sediminis]
MKEKKILVLGGKGKTGRRVAEKLIELNKEIRIGSRNETPAFDWENPETWSDALDDIHSIYITFQPDLAIPSAAETIKKFTTLAVDMGVKKMVLLSGRGEKEAEVSEQIVMNAGVDWTIVRASWFNQNFSESFFLDPILAGHIALPRGETPEPFIDVNDIADVVVESLLHDKHNGQIYELTGPRLLTFKQIIAEISKVTGREITFEALTIDDYTKMLREHQVPEDYIWLINYLFTEVLDGRNSNLTNDVEKVLGRKATDFTQYLKETVQTGIWNPVNQLP